MKKETLEEEAKTRQAETFQEDAHVEDEKIKKSQEEAEVIFDSSFNHFLQEKHMEEYPQLLDDDLPDAFEEWIEQLSTDELIKYADEYGEQKETEYFKKDFYIQSSPYLKASLGHEDRKKRVYEIVVKHNPSENRVFNVGKNSFGWTSGGLVLFTLEEFIKHIRETKGNHIYVQWPKNKLKD